LAAECLQIIWHIDWTQLCDVDGLQRAGNVDQLALCMALASIAVYWFQKVIHHPSFYILSNKKFITQSFSFVIKGPIVMPIAERTGKPSKS